MGSARHSADLVVYVLAEGAQRQVAGLAVVPLEREVEVLRFQRLQAGVALRAGAALVAGKQVDGLAALDGVPLRTTDAVAVAAAQDHAVGQFQPEAEARQRVFVLAARGGGVVRTALRTEEGRGGREGVRK